MEIVIAILLVVAGMIGLVSGGEFLVRSSARIASAIGVSPLVIGLTVVAFATSAPELAVVIQSSLAGKTDLAVGNAVGSNIFNVLFVLGLSALVSPLVVKARIVRWDVPLMIGASVLLLILALDGKLSYIDGSIMFGLLIIYIVWTILTSRKATREVKQEFADEYGEKEKSNLWVQLVWLILGLALLVLGADWVVRGCVTIAKSFGISELIIGLTVIAIGTSLPEVVASIVASYRGERDIAVGNIVGSNLFNILAVLGLGSAVAPDGIPVSVEAIEFDIPVMIAVAVACLPIFYAGHQISRWEGGVLFCYYLFYTTYLVMDATGNRLGPVVQVVFLGFVLPLSGLTILIGVYRYYSLRRQKSCEQEKETIDTESSGP